MSSRRSKRGELLAGIFKKLREGTIWVRCVVSWGGNKKVRQGRRASKRGGGNRSRGVCFGRGKKGGTK